MISSKLEGQTRSIYFDPNVASNTFYYDTDNVGIVSTQQFRVDWSNFANHVFFGSAAANLNIAYDKIINGYPYDGTREQLNIFLASLSGFERWLLGQIPSWVGHINLSSSYVNVEDRSGGAFAGNANSDSNSGMSLLSPLSGSLSVEMRLNPASSASQIVATHSGSANRWTMYITASTSPASCSVGFAVSTSTANMQAACDIPMGTFSHICCVYDASDTLTKLRLFVNGAKLAESSGSLKSVLDTEGNALLIGSGTAFRAGLFGTITPTRTLTASIDEFRIWHSVRDANIIYAEMNKPIYAQNNLRLYYKFNEPPPPLISGSVSSSADIVTLDSSGNALHGAIVNFTSAVRATSSIDGGILIGERKQYSPILFPEYPESILLRSTLLVSASSYDDTNPNNILRLVPKHILQSAREYDGAQTNGSLHTTYNSAGLPSTGIIGSTQLTVSLLYTIARFFDELKLGIDAFSNVDDALYDEDDTVPDQFIGDMINRRGFSSVPSLFSDATISQYVLGDNITENASTPAKSVRNELLRRFVSNIPDIIASKGTLHSIQSLLRSLGVDPDSSVKLKERSATGFGFLQKIQQNTNDVAGFVYASGSLYASSAYLSGSRLEIGWPQAAGSMLNKTSFPPHGISNQINDGLYTSGSWTVGLTACWPSGSLFVTQSIARLMTTGSAGRCCIVNITAVKDSIDSQMGKIVMYACPSATSGTAVTTLETATVHLFNSQPWRTEISFTREDQATVNAASASYTLSLGTVDSLYVTQSYVPVAQNSVYTSISSTYNASGAFIEFGAMAIPTIAGFLNRSTTPDASKIISENAYLGQIQFWSKSSSVEELTARAGAFTSWASINPEQNADGAPVSISGSFERLRLDVASRLNASERITDASGSITLLDSSRFLRHLNIINAVTSSDVGKPIMISQKRIPTSYDEAVSSDKVRVANYIVDANNSILESQRDTRFSIELSLIDALSKTMLDMLATTDPIATAIGGLDAQMSPDYPGLDILSNVFFDRLRSKLDFKAYFDAHRWLESLISTLSSQLIPHHAIFKGASFVIEPHAFERSKIEYRMSDRYLSVMPPQLRRDSIYLQQIIGQISR